MTKNTRGFTHNRQMEDVFGNDGNIVKDYFDYNINKWVFPKF